MILAAEKAANGGVADGANGASPSGWAHSEILDELKEMVLVYYKYFNKYIWHL